MATCQLAHGLAVLRRPGALDRQPEGASIDSAIAAALTLLTS